VANAYLERLRLAEAAVDEAVAAQVKAVAEWEDALRAAHDEGGYTLRELGELLGVSPQRVHQIIKPRPR